MRRFPCIAMCEVNVTDSVPMREQSKKNSYDDKTESLVTFSIHVFLLSQQIFAFSPPHTHVYACFMVVINLSMIHRYSMLDILVSLDSIPSPVWPRFASPTHRV
jgi:hypothetical protein